MRPVEALVSSDYEVRDVTQDVALDLVRSYHYARGGSKTAVYRHGLFLRSRPDAALGVAWWLPPTKPAAVSVAGEDWRSVLALTRLVVAPEVPTNGASFLLGRSIRLIRQGGVWRHLVTYADEGQGHTGAIYLATNWTPLGAQPARHPTWTDAEGRHVSPKATKNRTFAEMEVLGYARGPASAKRKFVIHIDERKAA